MNRFGAKHLYSLSISWIEDQSFLGPFSEAPCLWLHRPVCFDTFGIAICFSKWMCQGAKFVDRILSIWLCSIGFKTPTDHQANWEQSDEMDDKTRKYFRKYISKSSTHLKLHYEVWFHLSCRVIKPTSSIIFRWQNKRFRRLLDPGIWCQLVKMDSSLLQQQHSALQQEHTSLQQQHSALQQDHAALQQEHTALQQQHSALQEEHRELLLHKFAMRLMERVGKINRSHELAELNQRVHMPKCISSLSHSALWHYEMDGRWEAFPPEANVKMLQAYLRYLQDVHGCRSATINSGGVDRLVNFETMQQRHKTTNKVNSIHLATGAPAQWITPAPDLLQQGRDLGSFYKEVTDIHISESIRQILQTTGHALDPTSDCSCNEQGWDPIGAPYWEHATVAPVPSPADCDAAGPCNWQHCGWLHRPRSWWGIPHYGRLAKDFGLWWGTCPWRGWKDFVARHVLAQRKLHCSRRVWPSNLLRRLVWCWSLLCLCSLQKPPGHLWPARKLHMSMRKDFDHSWLWCTVVPPWEVGPSMI